MGGTALLSDLEPALLFCCNARANSGDIICLGDLAAFTVSWGYEDIVFSVATVFDYIFIRLIDMP